MDTLPRALSSDELRAAARLAGRRAAARLRARLGAEELGVADAVAVRGLLARGLAGRETRRPGRRPDRGRAVRAGPAARARTPSSRSSGTRTAAGRHGHVLGESANGLLLAAERSPSIWELRAVETPARARRAVGRRAARPGVRAGRRPATVHGERRGPGPGGDAARPGRRGRMCPRCCAAAGSTPPSRRRARRRPVRDDGPRDGTRGAAHRRHVP